MPLSLWLMPEEETAARLEALIARLARTRGTPAFSAHVTLLPSLRAREEEEALAKTAALAARTPLLGLTLARVAHAAAYFRCVFVDAEPGPELLGAHQRARRAFGGGPDRFRPHVSLVYGRLSEAEREELARGVREGLDLPLAVPATHLELRDTSGNPSRWRRCGRYRLGG